jgi:glycosyltransferase involved in cell wall biosynthesis
MPTIGYVLMGFPRVSETFIASELHRVEQAGVSLRLFVVKPVEERERDLRHPVVDAIRARPEHLPDAAMLTRPLHCWRCADVAPFAPALKRVARRRPLGLARALATTTAQALRDRPTRLSGPRKIYAKELLQAIALADRLLDAPGVRHLHAHFAHGTTTIAWHAARIAGLPFSFTGHARDIYAEHLNPKGWLRRKLLAARFVVTCTEANVRHLRGIAPEANVHLVYHGLNADFARMLAAPAAPAPASNGDHPVRVLAVGRLVAKKGFDVLVEAMAAGTPVIASAVSGIPELVEHEVNGLLVAPEDPAALADALLRLHGETALSVQLAERARATVAGRFDGARQASRLAELFREAIR